MRRFYHKGALDRMQQAAFAVGRKTDDPGGTK
jgi:hypothetical protein